MTESVKVGKSLSSREINARLEEYSSSTVKSTEKQYRDNYELIDLQQKTFVFSEKENDDRGLDIKDIEYQTSSSKKFEELSNIGKHTPQSRRTYQTPIIHV